MNTKDWGQQRLPNMTSKNDTCTFAFMQKNAVHHENTPKRCNSTVDNWFLHESQSEKKWRGSLCIK